MTSAPNDPRPKLSTDEKRELLRQLLRDKVAPTSESFPLSLGQRALWFLQRFVPESYAYNVPIALRFTPHLDLAHLQTAFDAVVDRHAALRLRFEEHDGSPRQKIASYASIPIEVREAPVSSDALRSEVVAEYRRPFALDGALTRATLWREMESDLLLITIHHLTFDGLSALLLVNDLGGYYRAAHDGMVYAPAPLRASYRDFVTAESRLLEHNADTRLWSYWSQQLGGRLEDLMLPSMRPRPAQMSLRGESSPIEIATDQLVQLKKIAQQQHTTVYAIIYTVLQAVLAQFTGQTDFVIGTPASARARPEWDNVVGYFINMMPIRAPLVPARTFVEQLQVVHNQLIGALSHAEFPFPAIVERLKVARDPARTPIFQAIVNVIQGSMRNAAAPAANPFGDAHVEQYHMPQLEGQFDLAIELTEGGLANGQVGMFGFWKYSTDALDAETAGRMLDSFRAMLALAAEHPTLPVHELIGRVARSANALHDDNREDLSF